QPRHHPRLAARAPGHERQGPAAGSLGLTSPQQPGLPTGPSRIDRGRSVPGLNSARPAVTIVGRGERAFAPASPAPPRRPGRPFAGARGRPGRGGPRPTETAMPTTVTLPVGANVTALFLAHLPRFEAHARFAFRRVDCPEARADRVAETLALAWRHFAVLA